MSRAKGASGGSGWSEGTKWMVIAGVGLTATAVVTVGIVHHPIITRYYVSRGLYYVWTRNKSSSRRSTKGGGGGGTENRPITSPTKAQEAQPVADSVTPKVRTS